MLDGDTPLNFSSSSRYLSIDGFSSILLARSRCDQLSAISDLKCNPGDEFLQCVRESLQHKGLDIREVDNILRYTIRYDPEMRAANFAELIAIMNDRVIENSCETVEPLREFRQQKLSANTKETSMETAKREFENFFTDSGHGSGRVFYGAGGTTHDIITVGEQYAGKSLPNIVKTSVSEEYYQLASSLAISLSVRASAAVQHALCKLTGFGIEPDLASGLQWLIKAASWGNVQAMALVYRLHQAQSTTIPVLRSTLETWLYMAASHGSLNAYDDLKTLNCATAIKARKAWLSQNINKLSHGINVHKHLVLSNFPLQDVALLQSVIDSKTTDPVSTFTDISEEVDIAEHNLLHYAVALGYRSAVKMLLSLGIKVNKPNMFGETALAYACRFGYLDLAKLLLRHGADPGMCNTFGSSPLHYCAFLEDTDAEELARMMVPAGSNPNAICLPIGGVSDQLFIAENHQLGGTPLHWAVYYNRIRFAATLLELGAKASQPEIDYPPMLGGLYGTMISKDLPRTSPMHLAAELHRLRLLKLLIEHHKHTGGDTDALPAAKIVLETSELRMMCLNGSSYQQDFIKTTRLLYRDRPMSLLMASAISDGQLILIEHIIQGGYDLETPVSSAGGLKPLQLALLHKSGRLALALLNSGADPCCRSAAAPCSPLTLLATRPDGSHGFTLARQLIERGNTHDVETGAQILLYRRAVIEGWTATADFLLEHGLNADETNRTLLVELLYQNSHASLLGLSYVLDHLPANALKQPLPGPFYFGQTLFHRLAATHERIRDDDLNYRILKYFLTKLPDRETLNQVALHSTAVVLAVCSGNYRAVDAFLQAGADPFLGRDNAFICAVDRVISVKEASGDFKTIASSGHYAQRHNDNSVKTMSVLFQHYQSSKRTSTYVENFIFKSRPLWCSDAYQEKKMAEGISSRTAMRDVKVSITSQNSFEVSDCKTGLCHQINGRCEESQAAFMGLWDAMLQEWTTVNEPLA